MHVLSSATITRFVEYVITRFVENAFATVVVGIFLLSHAIETTEDAALARIDLCIGGPV